MTVYIGIRREMDGGFRPEERRGGCSSSSPGIAARGARAVEKNVFRLRHR
eukprot:CAMPEP_0197189250 /NCGR_PEP_ID=MMETSP1423-20130617/19446_1 /TAXON_ID=476441 /ORGANISM="Pseudo-nitzschia heimii, Strain UNC1101" /LENGTH=49 /DNA_ID= /DNA_START= /DNA_END= /DNA_ORIENTATION=